MLSYIENNKLITNSLGNPYKNVELTMIHNSANHFGRKDNRFYRVEGKEVIRRDLTHLSRESINEKAIKRYIELTNDYDNYDFYDREKNVGYKVYPHMKGHPTVFKYSMIYPEICCFFRFWDHYHYNKDDASVKNSSYDLSKFFYGMENYNDLKSILSIEDEADFTDKLFKYYPEFAIFYFEIYPYIEMIETGSYDVDKLRSVRDQVYDLGFETIEFDTLISSIEPARNNAKVLQLLKK
jgi:hypothetical protein